MNWFEKLARKRGTRKFIKHFLANIKNSLILKQWEHRGWGDSINSGSKGLYGHLSGLRSRLGYFQHCDLHNGDVIVMDVSRSTDPRANGKKYEIGLFANVQVQSDPPDMFFASYVRLGFANNYEIETIKRLALERIESLKWYKRL